MDCSAHAASFGAKTMALSPPSGLLSRAVLTKGKTFRGCTFSISRSGFQSRRPLRQCVGYGNPTYKAIVTWTY